MGHMKVFAAKRAESPRYNLEGCLQAYGAGRYCLYIEMQMPCLHMARDYPGFELALQPAVRMATMRMHKPLCPAAIHAPPTSLLMLIEVLAGKPNTKLLQLLCVHCIESCWLV